MKLIYIWIDSYKKIEKQGFNLSGKYQVEYSSNDNVLRIERNKDYVKQFFLTNDDGCSNLDIVGVVGPNGAGKTTLLEVIWGACTVMPFDFIVYEDRNEIKICINDNQYTDMKVIVDEETTVSFYEECMDNLEMVYYSNVFDCNSALDYSFEVMYKRMHNISTNYLLNSSHYIVNNHWSITQREIFNSNEILDEIICMYNLKEKSKQLVPFRIPDEITLTIVDLRDMYCEENEMKQYYSKLYDLYGNGTNNLTIYKDLLYLNILLCFDRCEHLLGKVLKENITKDDYHISVNIEEILNDIKRKISSKHNYVQSKVDRIGEFINAFEEFTFYGKIDNIRLDTKSIRVKLDTMTYKMLLSYKNNVSGEAIICGWYDMSSGEKCLLSMYSRFYGLVRNNVIENNDILVLIDEIDTNLHPEWQRNIISNLVFMCNLFFKKKNVQILITSHSPFIISDLPSSNVIYLDINTRNTKKRKNDMGINTFAANIHTLYSKAFFLDNTIGEFATVKIKEVIRDLKEKTSTEILSISGRKEEIEYIINNIGEPVIKRKLVQLYQKRFPEKIEDYKAEIGKLKETILSLQEQLKNKSIGGETE